MAQRIGCRRRAESKPAPRAISVCAISLWLLLLLPALSLANQAPQVANILAQQRPGTMLVDVTYDLYDADGDAMTVTLRLSEDGGQTYPLLCSTFGEGSDVGSGILSGTGKQIVWDAGADYPGHMGDEYVVKVIADDGTSPGGMVLVPAGSFIMGDGSAICGTVEHPVTLTRAFYLSQHEVTNQEYVEAVQWAYDNGHVTATTASVHDNLDGSTEVLLDLADGDCEIRFDNGVFNLRDVGHGINPDHPVKEVTWYGAVRYCDWLSLQEGLPRAYQHSGDWACNNGDPYGASGYRLPTDAEWEYAGQFDDERIYPWGNEDPDCSRVNFNVSCVGWTSPVGNYPGAPVIQGEPLYDMAGNLWEWCNDWWECDLGVDPATDPTGPVTGVSRLLRGGGWHSVSWDLLVARRGNVPPGENRRDAGFRFARTSAP